MPRQLRLQLPLVLLVLLALPGGARATEPETERRISVAVLLGDFADARLNEAEERTMRAGLRDPRSGPGRFFGDLSGGRWVLSVRVFGPYHLDWAAGPGCERIGWGSQIEAAARAAGVELDDYTNIMVAWPRRSACPFAGWGDLPGRRIWLNGPGDERIWAHELGHNLGLGHARTVACAASAGPVPWSGSCPERAEYGDAHDAMGSGRRLFSGAMRAALGLLEPGASATISEPGTYRLAADWRPDGVRLLRLADTGLALEYRGAGPSELDSPGRNGAEPSGLLIRMAGGGASDLLLVGGPDPLVGSLLGPGRRFIEPTSGWSVELTAADGAEASVRIERLGGLDLSPPSAPEAWLALDGPPAWLAWSAAGDDRGVVGYAVLRDGAIVARLAPEASGFADVAAPPGPHVWEVVALDAAGNAAATRIEGGGARASSEEFVEPPEIPGPLRLLGVGPRAATIAWPAAVVPGGLAGYELRVDGRVVPTFDLTWATLDRLVPASRITVSLVACDLLGQCSQARRLVIRTPAGESSLPAPATPDGRTLGDPLAPDGLLVRLTWSPVAGAGGYRVRRAGSLVATVATSGWSDPAPPSGPVRYEIRAIDERGREGAPATLEIAPASGAPARPLAATGLTAPARPAVGLRGRRASLRWAPVPGAIAYELLVDGRAVALLGAPRGSLSLPPGRRSLAIRAIDERGRRGPRSPIAIVAVR